MSRARTALDVARWEFQRYFKLKQQIAGLLIMAVISAIVFLVVRFSRESDETRNVSVIAAPAATLPRSTESITFSPAAADAEAELRRAVAAREIDGLLLLDTMGTGQLIVQRRAPWIGELREILTDIRRAEVLERTNLSAEALADMLAPAELDIVVQDARDRARAGSRIGFVVIISLMMMGIFTGLGYIFASITGEKQIRVTEQVMSAIPPQVWIDGKIYGITAVSIVSVLVTAVGIGVAIVVMRLVGVPIPIPSTLGDPVILAAILVFALLGLLFWLSFLAAIAAMIDDPNTSTRGSLLLVPIVASGIAIIALGNPDSTLLRILSLLPITAPTAMPARTLLTDVPPFEVALSIALLIAGLSVLRIAAGRVFRVAMLMYGKEPTWAEVRRWVMAR